MGLDWNYEIFGLCGRLLPPVNKHLVDEIYRLHELDGWREGSSMPLKANALFLDINDDPCFGCHH